MSLSKCHCHILSYARQWILAGNDHHVQELLNFAVLRLTTFTHTLVHELVSLVEGPIQADDDTGIRALIF